MHLTHYMTCLSSKIARYKLFDMALILAKDLVVHSSSFQVSSRSIH